MLDSEWFSSTTHAGHDFVGDEENSMTAADFRDAFCIAVGRNGCSECCADHRFENEGGDGFGVVCREKGFEVFGAGEFAAGKSLVEGTVIAEAGCDVAPLLEEWLIRSSARDIAADGHGTECAAVIALAARDDAEFFWRGGFEMELAGEFDGGFGGFRAAGGEVDAAVGEICRGESEEAGGEFFGRSGVELRRVGECDLRGLGSHGVGDGLDAMTDADDCGLARSIEVALAIRRDDPGAFASDGSGERFFEVAGEERRVCGHGEIVANAQRVGSLLVLSNRWQSIFPFSVSFKRVW